MPRIHDCFLVLAIAATALVGAGCAEQDSRWNRGYSGSNPRPYNVPAAAQGAPKYLSNSNSAWYQACEEAVAKRVGKDHPNAGRVQTLSDTVREWQVSKSETGLEGRGKFERANGKWQKFYFQCTYNIRKGKITQANYSINE